MIVIWEAKDIKCGRTYSKNGMLEIWLIGYLSMEESEAKYVSISNQDGMVTGALTREHMAETLTLNGYLPVELM